MLMPMPRSGRGPAADFTVLISLVGGLLVWLVLASYALGRTQRLAVQQLQADVGAYVAGELTGARTAAAAQQALADRPTLARLTARMGLAVGSPAGDTRRVVATIGDPLVAAPTPVWIVQETETPGTRMAPGRPELLQGFVILALAATCGLGAMLLFRLQRQHEATTARTNFVRVVSHELRTPLAQILMFAETLRLGRTRTDSDRVFALDVILQETRRLSRLVENVLRFTRLEHGTTALRQEVVDVSAIVRETAAQFIPAGISDGARIQVEGAARCEALGDRDALRQVLVNLFDNAIKHGTRHSAVHGPVRAVVSRTASHVEVRVEDEGVGISAGDRERIWHAFERGSVSSAGDVGTGLGLTIVRALTDAMDGTVRLDLPNEHEQTRRGARFVVTLLAHDAVAGARESAPAVVS